MVITCWSVKGGSGTTVVAACLAVLAARRADGDAVLVDLGGDAAAALGMTEPLGPGIGDWLADPRRDLASLLALTHDVGPNLRLLTAGSRTGASYSPVAAALDECSATVIIDAGVLSPGPTFDLISAATTSLLVIRPCYLALRRAAVAPVRPTGIVLVTELSRALSRKDVESVLGVPVVAEVPSDPIVARAVDAGLLAGRLPKILSRPLDHAA
jgi:MinD-like ATPase involved in chromosome partitioning or flagellar assembly